MDFTSFEDIVSMQKNLYATKQNPQINMSHVLMATSSSTANAVPLLRWRRLFVKSQFIKLLHRCRYLVKPP